jgi:hypothetical protein
MREHLEDLKWLKAHVRPRFWQKFVADVNAYRPCGALELKNRPFYFEDERGFFAL